MAFSSVVFPVLVPPLIKTVRLLRDVADVRARGLESVACRAAELDGDHRVVAAVRDRDVFGFRE